MTKDAGSGRSDTSWRSRLVWPGSLAAGAALLAGGLVWTAAGQRPSAGGPLTAILRALDAPFAAGQPSGTPTNPPMAPGAPAADTPPLAIDYADNVVEFGDRRALGRFFRKWQAGRFSPVTIAHFGDSHVQPGWQIGEIRGRLQKLRGGGGRGMIFPYAIAKTYSQEDYASSFTGVWKTANSIQQPPRLPVGVSGFVATTTDSVASTSFTFTRAPAMGPVTVGVQVRVVGAPYRLTLSSGAASRTQTVRPAPGGRVQTVRFELPQIIGTLKLAIDARPAADAPDGGGPDVSDGPGTGRIQPLPSPTPMPMVQPLPGATPTPGYTLPPGVSFSLYGLDLRDRPARGLVYDNLGVGGAAYNALLQQSLFEQTYPSLGADLVILDWGTNDVLYTNTIAGDFTDTVRRTIRRIRAIDPEVTIMITAPMDERYKGNDVTMTGQLALLLRGIALQEHCLFYDWYRVAGGSNAMAAWSANGLSSKDKIHLNQRGYRTKGGLAAQALLRMLAYATANPDAASLLQVNGRPAPPIFGPTGALIAPGAARAAPLIGASARS